MNRRTVWVVVGLTCLALTNAFAQEPDLGKITERHEMIPMRDGKRLSAYLHFPPGDGP
jgi:predicted acyl esterase